MLKGDVGIYAATLDVTVEPSTRVSFLFFLLIHLIICICLHSINVGMYLVIFEPARPSSRNL